MRTTTIQLVCPRALVCIDGQWPNGVWFFTFIFAFCQENWMTKAKQNRETMTDMKPHRCFLAVNYINKFDTTFFFTVKLPFNYLFFCKMNKKHSKRHCESNYTHNSLKWRRNWRIYFDWWSTILMRMRKSGFYRESVSIDDKNNIQRTSVLTTISHWRSQFCADVAVNFQMLLREKKERKRPTEMLLHLLFPLHLTNFTYICATTMGLHT